MANARTGYDRWKEGIDKASGASAWNEYDCEIIAAVNEFNRHLSGQGGFFPLDWQIIKAMVWVESGGPSSPAWKTKPIQIGVSDDPGLNAFLSGNEGGDLILPPLWQGRINRANATSYPAYNIRAGIGYLLMRLAYFSHQSVVSGDKRVHEIIVKPGDTIDRIARRYGSTPEVIKQLNPASQILRPGQTLKYQKAAIRRVITGWRPMTSAIIATRYNGGGNPFGDPMYAAKLDYALTAVRKNVTTPTCRQ